jgi:hypothetical protein
MHKLLLCLFKFLPLYKNINYFEISFLSSVYSLNTNKYSFKPNEMQISNEDNLFSRKISKKNDFKKLSILFVRLNFFSFNKKRVIHPIFKNYYLSISSEDLRVLNLSKFNEVYLNAIYLLYNLFYFNIKFCFFTSPSLKQEAEILN